MAIKFQLSLVRPSLKIKIQLQQLEKQLFTPYFVRFDRQAQPV